MLSFTNLALRRGPQLLLSGVDLSLHAGWRVGVIGRNGCGKSSLFAAIQGELEPDQGEIGLSSRVRIAGVAQETPSLPDPALEFVISGDEELWTALSAERAAMEAEDYEAVARAHQILGELQGYDAEARGGRLLHGLGFPAATHARPVAEFSGGWRVRLNLARALMTPSELLLLDEPTNHLDLDAVLWLEQWLLKYPGTLMLISHDREFLDGVCTHILHLHEGKAKLYVGDYTAFERQRAEHLRQQQIAFEKEQAEREHLQKFIDRFRAKASKATQAQSRIKRLEKLAGTEALRAERALRINFEAPARLPFSLITLDRVTAGYPRASAAEAHEHLPEEISAQAKAVPVLHHVNFALEAGDRIALLGPNGAGKSTLIKTLVGALPPLAGERRSHGDLSIGYFAQHTVESLKPGTSPIEHLREIAPGSTPQQMRNFLGRWYFTGDRAFEPVDHFSGGERARLALALLAWRKPNVLLLDEPTNHLDLDMREALAEALLDYDGAIVLVSHDRHLIGLVCDTFLRVSDGKLERFRGDLDEYAAWLRSRLSGSTAKPEKPSGPAEKGGGGAKGRDPNAAGGAKATAKRQRRLEQVEGELETTLAERDALEMQLADPSLYTRADGAEVETLTARHAALAAAISKLETEWLRLSEEQHPGASASGD
jgi:ATP-binding cassette, subfamily F, member 3